MAKKLSNSEEAVTASGEFGVWCMKPLKEIGSGWFGVMGDTSVTATTVRPATWVRVCGCWGSVHSTGLTQSTWVRVWVQRYCTHYRINLIHLVRVWGVEMLYTQHRIHSLHLSEVVYTIQVGVGVHSVMISPIRVCRWCAHSNQNAIKLPRWKVVTADAETTSSFLKRIF